MQLGDLLLIKARFDPVGWIIRKALHCQYNHVAWVINDEEIIELRARGILSSNPNRYFNKFLYKTKLLRIKNINLRILYEVMYYATCSQIKGSYYKLWITYLMILFKSKKEYPRPTCSGFISIALSWADFHFDKTKKPRNITPADMEKSENTYGVDVRKLNVH